MHRSLAAACSAARRRAAMAGSCCPSATATEARRCPTTRARPFRGRMDDCSYSLSRMRRSGTARCRRPLPGPRTCYRTRRAQKTRRVLVRGKAARRTAIHTRRARETRAEGVAHTLRTHYERDTTAGTREAYGTHTQFKNATACLQNTPSPDCGAGDGTTFRLTALRGLATAVDGFYDGRFRGRHDG